VCPGLRQARRRRAAGLQLGQEGRRRADNAHYAPVRPAVDCDIVIVSSGHIASDGWSQGQGEEVEAFPLARFCPARPTDLKSERRLGQPPIEPR
jgi:hypothetical protein